MTLSLFRAPQSLLQASSVQLLTLSG